MTSLERSERQMVVKTTCLTGLITEIKFRTKKDCVQ